MMNYYPIIIAIFATVIVYLIFCIAYLFDKIEKLDYQIIGKDIHIAYLKNHYSECLAKNRNVR